MLVSVLEGLCGNPNLSDIAGTIHSPCRFTSHLNGGDSETNQQTDNTDDDEEFDKCEPLVPPCFPRTIQRDRKAFFHENVPQFMQQNQHRYAELYQMKTGMSTHTKPKTENRGGATQPASLFFCFFGFSPNV
jgi:hypothetical protein